MMKKTFLIICGVVTLGSVLISVAVSRGKSDSQSSSMSHKSQSSIGRKKDEEPMYILKANGDSIAVFTPDGKTVREVDTVVLKSLPEYDQMLLDNGIEVYSEKELGRLIEDYDS